MSTQAGLWIDHRNAVIVIGDGDETTTTKTIESNVEGHVRFSGGSGSGGSHGSREGGGEDTRERHFEGQLDKYYDEVIKVLRGAQSIWIFGPGEAKGELKARLDHAGLAAHIAGIETVDKMTDGQIAAKARELFARPAQPTSSPRGHGGHGSTS